MEQDTQSEVRSDYVSRDLCVSSWWIDILSLIVLLKLNALKYEFKSQMKFGTKGDYKEKAYLFLYIIRVLY